MGSAIYYPFAMMAEHAHGVVLDSLSDGPAYQPAALMKYRSWIR